MKKKCINPINLFDSRQYGFSQIVVSNPGKMVHISGQVAWDEHLNVIGENDLGQQMGKAMENLKTAIESVGGTLEHVVMLRIYKVNFKKEDGPVISEILKKYFSASTLPASTWLSVSGLANEKFMIEIEAQAVI
ncbi:MAG: RidA family protein [Bacteroidota bacterium]